MVVQLVNSQLRILFGLESSLHFSSRLDACHLLDHNNFQRLAEAKGGMNFATTMLGETTVKVVRRPNVVPSAGTSKNVNRCHQKREWVDWDSNPEPTPKAFGAALLSTLPAYPSKRNGLTGTRTQNQPRKYSELLY